MSECLVYHNTHPAPVDSVAQSWLNWRKRFAHTQNIYWQLLQTWSSLGTVTMVGYILGHQEDSIHSIHRGSWWLWCWWGCICHCCHRQSIQYNSLTSLPWRVFIEDHCKEIVSSPLLGVMKLRRQSDWQKAQGCIGRALQTFIVFFVLEWVVSGHCVARQSLVCWDPRIAYLITPGTS